MREKLDFCPKQSPSQFVAEYAQHWRNSHPAFQPQSPDLHPLLYRVVTGGLVLLLAFLTLSASGCSGERSFVRTGKGEGLLCSRQGMAGAMVCVPAKVQTEKNADGPT